MKITIHLTVYLSVYLSNHKLFLFLFVLISKTGCDISLTKSVGRKKN